jgi:leucyl-tRNA synthetase
MSYIKDFSKIEEFSKELWKRKNVSKVEIDPRKEKEVVLDFFPYPSGVGLHVGHPLGYIATDIYARFKRLQGKNVLHAMGYDAFGLPAEQFAIENKQHPEIITKKNIANIEAQLDRLGLNHDKDRTFSTTDPDYYKWTQFIFVKLFNSYFDEKENKAKSISILEEELRNQGFKEELIHKELNKKRLAYLSSVKVNWCANLGTVLADEEVIGGLSERGSHPVVKKSLKQWVLRITKYSKRLLDNLELLDWPESVKEMQTNWIGYSKGYEISFKFLDKEISVYTTSPHTLSGVTFLAVSKEHPLIDEIVHDEALREKLKNAGKDFGFFTNSYAYSNLNGQKLPIYVADYVLPYGTCAVMGVPAHDERDFKFAKAHNLPIIAVVKPDPEFLAQYGITVPYCKKNKLYNNNTPEEEVLSFEKNSWITKKENTKLRDWIFSRQRYWGEPFPIVFDEANRAYCLTLEQLPVELPYLEDINANDLEADQIHKPLNNAKEWRAVRFIKLDNNSAFIVNSDKETYEYNKRIYKICDGLRETNTMPNWAGSCWYYLRYMDNKNEKELIGKEAKDYWAKPKKIGTVDLYLGGAEHAVLHLLYARFWHMVLYDLGIVDSPEPFQRLFNQGMITGPAYSNENGNYFAYKDVEKRDGKFYSLSTKEELNESIVKIGKRYKNGVTPEEICNEYSVDALRLFIMYLGPLEQSKPWDHSAIKGMVKLLEHVYALKINESTPRVYHYSNELRKKLEHDYQNLRFNTAISSIIIFLNEFANQLDEGVYKNLLIMVSPLMPHLAEYLFENRFKESVVLQNWPAAYDIEFEEEFINAVISINGKKREEIKVKSSLNQEEIDILAQRYCLEHGINFTKIIIPAKKTHWMINIVQSHD